jgi:hypothetical protein
MHGQFVPQARGNAPRNPCYTCRSRGNADPDPGSRLMQ